MKIKWVWKRPGTRQAVFKIQEEKKIMFIQGGPGPPPLSPPSMPFEGFFFFFFLIAYLAVRDLLVGAGILVSRWGFVP